MKARILKANKVRELYLNIEQNIDLYREGDFQFLGLDQSYSVEIEHEIHETVLSTIDCIKGGDNKEVDNCINLYSAMGTLSPYLARDERLWTYLTHTNLLQYSKNRWPIPNETQEAVKHIRTHFFVVGARGFERDNAAARLWWMAHLCNRANDLILKDALTCMLFQYDVRANIIERPTTSQSVSVFSAILCKLNESYHGDKVLFKREIFRLLMKKVNLLGGIKLLSALDDKEIRKVLELCITEVCSENGVVCG